LRTSLTSEKGRSEDFNARVSNPKRPRLPRKAKNWTHKNGSEKYRTAKTSTHESRKPKDKDFNAT